VRADNADEIQAIDDDDDSGGGHGGEYRRDGPLPPVPDMEEWESPPPYTNAPKFSFSQDLDDGGHVAAAHAANRY